MEQLKIKNSCPIQTNFLGLNAVYHGYAGFSDNAGRVYSKELCDLEVERAADLGLKIARTRYQWIAYDFEKNCWDWENSPDFNAFCSWVERLKSKNIEVALNVAWCNISDIMSNGWGGKSPFTVGDDWQASVQNYARWVSESVHQLVEVRGLTNVKYLIMFTEPQRLAATIPLPKGVDHQFTAWYQATKAASEQLKKDGRRHLVKLVGPNEGAVYQPQMMKWIIKKDPQLLDVYSCHNYLVYLNRRVKSPVGGTVVFEAFKPGHRIWQPVELQPNTAYEFSFLARLKTSNYRQISGYVIYGAFLPNKQGRIQSGGQLTTRLGPLTTNMAEGSHLNNTWQRLTVRFQTGKKTKGAAVGLFADLKGFPFSFLATGFSLKKCGSEEQLLQNPNLSNGLNGWQAFTEEAKYPAYNAYSFWEMNLNLAKAALPPKADFWFDEYNINFKNEKDEMILDYAAPEYGTQLAIARVAMVNSGVQSSLQWTLFDQLWPNSHGTNKRDRWKEGVHCFGVMPCLLQSRVPYPAYYAVRVTGLVGGGPGTKVFLGQCGKNLKLTMTQAPTGEVTVLVVNTAKTEVEFCLTFEQALQATLNRYLYNPQTVTCSNPVQPLQQDKTFFKVGLSFSDKLPAGAVAAYTNKIIN